MFWTVYVTSTGQVLLPDVQTAIIIIPASAGIAALLWAFELEHIVIGRSVMAVLRRSPHAAWSRYVMAFTVLFLRPWQSSIDPVKVTVAKSQMEGIQRVLRSSLLSKNMEDLYYLFWLEISLIPYIYLASRVMPEFAQLTTGFGLVLGAAALLCVLYRKGLMLLSIPGLAYCNWYVSVVDADEAKRKTIRRIQQVNEYPVTDFRSIVRVRVQDLLKQAEQGDWMGFRDGHDALINMMSSLVHETSILHIRSLVVDLLWSYEQIASYEPLPTGVTLPFAVVLPMEVRVQARAQVLDALSELSSFEKENPKPDWQSEILAFIDSWKLLDNWYKIYSILTEDIIRKLNQETVRRLAVLPSNYWKDGRKVGFADSCNIGDSPPRWPMELAVCLFYAEDRKMLDAKTVVDAATKWHVWPDEYSRAYSAGVRKLLAEESMGIPAMQFKKVLEDLISRTGGLDSMKTATNIAHYRGDPEFGEILKELSRLGKSGKHYATVANDVLKVLDEFHLLEGQASR